MYNDFKDTVVSHEPDTINKYSITKSENRNCQNSQFNTCM